MKKSVIAVIITILALTLCSCGMFEDDTNSMQVSMTSEDLSSDMSEDNSINIGDAYYSYNFLFSNTGAKTEDFVVYDSSSSTSLLDDYIEGSCKIHITGYHGYTSFDIYKLGSEENINKFTKRFWLSNKEIDGKPFCRRTKIHGQPVCRGLQRNSNDMGFRDKPQAS